MIYQISRDYCEEIVNDCIFPVLTLCSVCKHTIRLSYERKELDLHPDLDFRLLHLQSKGGRPKKVQTWSGHLVLIMTMISIISIYLQCHLLGMQLGYLTCLVIQNLN